MNSPAEAEAASYKKAVISHLDHRLLPLVCGAVFCALAIFSSAISPAAENRLLSCWRCRQSFEIPIEKREGNCPHCDAPFILPAAVQKVRKQPSAGAAVSRPETADLISFEDAGLYVGQTKTIEGSIVSSYLSPYGGDFYLNYHRDFQRFVSIKIPAEARGRFPPNPADYFRNTVVQATGTITREGRYLRQVVTEPSHLVVTGSWDAARGGYEADLLFESGQGIAAPDLPEPRSEPFWSFERPEIAGRTSEYRYEPVFGVEIGSSGAADLGTAIEDRVTETRDSIAQQVSDAVDRLPGR